MPGMEEANPIAVLRAVKDPNCLAICPQMEGREIRLEELMLLSEILRGENITAELDSIEPLTSKQKALIAELFEDMEVAHKHLTCSCSTLGILLRSLNS